MENFGESSILDRKPDTDVGQLNERIADLIHEIESLTGELEKITDATIRLHVYAEKSALTNSSEANRAAKEVIDNTWFLRLNPFRRGEYNALVESIRTSEDRLASLEAYLAKELEERLNNPIPGYEELFARASAHELTRDDFAVYREGAAHYFSEYQEHRESLIRNQEILQELRKQIDSI